MVQAISVCGPRGETVPVEGIRLRKIGEYTLVDAEIGGVWIEVIRERSDGAFCHIVEPSGMLKAYYAMPADAAPEPAQRKRLIMNHEGGWWEVWQGSTMLSTHATGRDAEAVHGPLSTA